MGVQDYISRSLFVAFGLWFIFFPASVIRFYTWFHGGKVEIPGGTPAVRLAGACWVVLVVTIFIIWSRK